MPIGTLTAHDGIAYTVMDEAEIAELPGPRWLVRWTLKAPDGEIWEIAVIRSAAGLDGTDPILCPADWQGPMPKGSRDVRFARWVDIETGAAAVMVDGNPVIPPFSGGRGARLGSYGQ